MSNLGGGLTFRFHAFAFWFAHCTWCTFSAAPRVDQQHKHGVWRPTGASTGVRMSAVWRWSQRSESFSVRATRIALSCPLRSRSVCTRCVRKLQRGACDGRTQLGASMICRRAHAMLDQYYIYSPHRLETCLASRARRASARSGSRVAPHAHGPRRRQRLRVAMCNSRTSAFPFPEVAYNVT